jgi:hypothetical protein
LNENATRKFVELMAVRTAPIHQNELTNYLRTLHPFALKLALKEFAEHGVEFAPNLRAADMEKFRRSALKNDGERCSAARDGRL